MENITSCPTCDADLPCDRCTLLRLVHRLYCNHRGFSLETLAVLTGLDESRVRDLLDAAEKLPPEQTAEVPVRERPGGYDPPGVTIPEGAAALAQHEVAHSATPAKFGIDTVRRALRRASTFKEPVDVAEIEKGLDFAERAIKRMYEIPDLLREFITRTVPSASETPEPSVQES